MTRILLALDVQPFYRMPEPIIQSISRGAGKMPSAGTVFVHREEVVPFEKLTGKKGPTEPESPLVSVGQVFEKNSYHLPEDLVEWLKMNDPDEVLITGGHTDTAIIAAGVSVFDAGMRPALVPPLCYGNEWFQHTVTINIWSNSLGPVYEHPMEAGI